jgi:hypothetical protein
LVGKQTQVRDVYATAQAASQNTEVKVQLAGGIEVNFTGAAADLSVQQKEQVTKMVVDRIGSMNWQQFAVNVTTPSNPLKGPVSTAYSA